MARSRTRSRSSQAAYLVVGEDAYLRELFREEIIAAHVPAEAREFAVARFALDRGSLAEVIRQALCRPMLSPRQVLLLSGVEQLDDEDQEALAAYFEEPADFTVLVFEAESVDRRRRVVRLLEECCEVREASSPNDAGARRAVEKFARDLGVRLAGDAAEELVYAVGSDLGRLRCELEKIRTFVGSRREIRSEDVAAVVLPARQFSVFELADCLAERRRDDALRLLRQLLAAGESPIGMVGLLAWLYRQLLLARTLPPGTPVWKAAQKIRAPRSRVESVLRQAQRFEARQLQQGFAQLLETDVALKSSPADPAAVLERLVVRLTAVRRVAATSP